MNVVTKNYRAFGRKGPSISRRCARSIRAGRTAAVRSDRRKARQALAVGDWEAPRAPLALFTERDL